MRAAYTHAQTRDVLDRILAFAAVAGAVGILLGAVLAQHGYGARGLLAACSGVLLLSAFGGLQGEHLITRLHRGEVARVYAAVLHGEHHAARYAETAGHSQLERLALRLASLLETTRLALLRRNDLVRWATQTRSTLADRLQGAQRLAAGMTEDAHVIAEAADETRRGDANIGHRLLLVQGHAGAALTATDAVAHEAAMLADAVRAVTARTEQATALASRLSTSTFDTQRGIAAMAEATVSLCQAAEVMSQVLFRAEGGCAEAAGDRAQGKAALATMRDLAVAGRTALDPMMTTVHELRLQSGEIAKRVQEISDIVQAQHEFGHALSHAALLQADAVGRLLQQLGTAQGEVRTLHGELHGMELPEKRLGTGANAQKAVERLPGYADAMAQILKGLPELNKERKDVLF